MVVPTPTSWSLSLSVSDTALKRTSWRNMLGDERYGLRPASRLGSGRSEQYSGRVKRSLIRSLPEGRRSKRVGNAQAKGCYCPLARLGVCTAGGLPYWENSARHVVIPQNLLEALGSKALVGRCELGSHIQGLPDSRIKTESVSAYSVGAVSCLWPSRAATSLGPRVNQQSEVKVGPGSRRTLIERAMETHRDEWGCTRIRPLTHAGKEYSNRL